MYMYMMIVYEYKRSPEMVRGIDNNSKTESNLGFVFWLGHITDLRSIVKT